MKKFRWNRSAPTDGPVADVNMTPLIDVSLVLVVILLLATPLAFESSLGLRRTATAVAAVGEEALPSSVSLNILSNTEVAVNDVIVKVEDLPRALPPLLAAVANREVAVWCAGTVSHGTFVQVLDITKLSGAQGIAITETRLGAG